MNEFISHNVCSVPVFMHRFQLYLNRPLLLLDITVNCFAGITLSVLIKTRFRLNNNNQKRQIAVSLVRCPKVHHWITGWSVYCRQMNWNTPLKGWWMDWHTHERLQDLDSAWLWDRWVGTTTEQFETSLNIITFQAGLHLCVCVFEMCVKIISTPGTTDSHFLNFQTCSSLHWLKEWTHIFI